MYEICDLSFSYENEKVLHHVNCRIPKGKFTTIIGPNGSGKTTLFGLMSGQFEPYLGDIFFQSKNLRKYNILELSQKIAMISQNVNIRFPFTCMEVVMMGRTPFKGRMKKLGQEDLDIVYQSMEITETLKFSDTPITQLSGGERQRVMVAKALAQTPEVLFLDESFSNMDIQYTIKLLNLLKDQVKTKGLTVISIMHDLNLTDLYSDHILAIKDGKVVGNGDCQKIMIPTNIKEWFGVQIQKMKGKGLMILPSNNL